MKKVAKGAKKGTGAETKSDLVAEAVNAPESHWFIALLRSGGVYLIAITVFLGAAASLIVVFKKVFKPLGEDAGLNIWVPASALALALFFAIVFNLLPTLRRRRERNLRTIGVAAADYFSTAPREDYDPFHLFANGYEAFLTWVNAPRAPLLHLTGLSGSGKSSLVSAYLAPHLRKSENGLPTRVIILRSYADPLLALKGALLPFWKRPPEGYENLSAYDTLCRAARHLEDSERLLVVFDQFEEYFLLRATASATTPLAVADAEHTSLRNFFGAYLASPPAEVNLLIVYREDHRRLIAPLNLPARQERVNWMSVEPLDFSAATRFLRSCPGLSIPQGRMELVLREAARQEGGRVVMRPIVANLLGLILQRMSGHPALWQRTGDLLRSYVRDCLGQEVAEDRAFVLRSLLTDFHTTRPRSVSELSRHTRLDSATLSQQLETLGHAGLLRCLDMQQSENERTWQIAHDFLAALIERVLDGFHRPLWRTLRPWVAPTMLVVAFTIDSIWPWLRKQQDINNLTNAGLTWNENSRTIKSSRSIFLFPSEQNVLSSIHRLHPRELDLSYPTLKDIRVLRGFTDLSVLNLSNTPYLTDLGELIGFEILQDLDLSNCEALLSTDGLRNMNNLLYLKLKNCKALEDVNSLGGLANLEFIDLSNCEALRDIDGLKGLRKLNFVDLRGCKSLEDVDGLQEANLSSVDVSNCLAMKDLDGLRGSAHLAILDMSNCESLRDIEGLRGLINLGNVDMSNCKSLEDLGVMRTLINIEALDLSFCETRRDIDVLRGLKNLRRLNLMNCKGLRSVEALRDLKNLRTLEVSNCSSLSNVEALQNLNKLVFLDLYGCDQITDEIQEKIRAWLPSTDIIFPDGSRGR